MYLRRRWTVRRTKQQSNVQSGANHRVKAWHEPSPRLDHHEDRMQIKLSSIMVEDQDRALDFYTNTLGFVKLHDIPMGPFRWLTVTSPDGVDGMELVLEPMGFPPAKVYQKQLYDAGIPTTAFMTTDIDAEFKRLSAAGVKFRGEPERMGPIATVLFEDTCGNLINLVQPTP